MQYGCSAVPCALMLGLLLAGCGSSGGGNSSGTISVAATHPGQPETITLAPENTGDGWSVSSPAAEDVEASSLRSTLELLRDGRYSGIDAMVVVRHGRLLAEGYFNGFGRESLHDLRSSGKSFTSALAGIAIEQGLIGLNEPVAQIIPQFENHAHMDDRKRAITIFHLLNMNSGLECDDWNASSPGNETRMYAARDWIGFMLDLRMINDPGTVAAYCSGAVVVLGHGISLRAGMGLDDYASTYLFAPLGIQQSAWRRSPDGRATGGGGLQLTPRDAAKFGQLYLNGGVWNGLRVVPTTWIEQSQQRINVLGGDGYGLLWWKRTFSYDGKAAASYYTAGNGGNFIFVFPDLDLVVVFTGSNYDSPLMDQPFEILSSHLLPVVR